MSTAATTPIADLLVSPPGAGDARAGRIVAFGAGGSRTLAELSADAAALAEARADDTGRRWLVDTEDTYRVAVVLLAAARIGARACLPPNLGSGTLAELAAECTVVFTDTAAKLQGDIASVDPLSFGLRGAGTHAPQPVAVDRDRPWVELFTSGSSGPGRLVTKAMRHLEDEVVALEQMFGAGLEADTPVFATVSARHLYGLLFRLLWPLSTLRPMARMAALLPDELMPPVAQSGGAVVVSTPVHLRHLAAWPALAATAPAVRELFSSGGALETDTALALAAAIGRAPVEIFGSTETGGVAWRRPSIEDPEPDWTVFAPVHIDAQEQQLTVESPFVTAPAPEGTVGAARWRMGDRIERRGTSFRLLGRSDRVVKIAEKAFSLPEIEADLARHPLVEQVAVGTLEMPGATRLGALVVLTAEGRLRLAEIGRRALGRELAEHLAPHWDRVALPRRWRFVEALPADERGKLAAAAVTALLEAPSPKVLRPLLLSEDSGPITCSRRLVVPRDLAYLEGHYDAFPLVAGVVQIHWVMDALAELKGVPAVAAERMEAIKFKDVLRPGQQFTLEIAIGPEPTRAQFSLSDGDRTFSSGRIHLLS